MSLPLFIANRYLRSRRRTGFISLITYISVFGIIIGVMALIATLSVMNGFESAVKERIIGFDAHIRMRTFGNAGISNLAEVMDTLSTIPQITGMAPYISEQGMLRHRTYTSGLLVKATDESLVEGVSCITEKIIDGKFSLHPPADSSGRSSPGIILGRYLADQVAANVGDLVTIISPSGVTSAFSMPLVQQFLVTGVFELGLAEYDNSVAYISIDAGQKLFKMGDKVSGVEIKLNNIDNTDLVKTQIQNKLGYPYYPLTWYEMRQTLFKWMKLEKLMMTIVLSLIITVAAFNIISSQIMTVLEKKKDIAIYKSMGASSGQIRRIFITEGLIVGLVGAIAGTLGGFLLCWTQLKFEWIHLPGDVYIIDALPIRMEITDFLAVVLIALLLALLASIYPAHKASRIVPVEILRYE